MLSSLPPAGDLKQKVSIFEVEEAQAIIGQVKDLYDTYLLPSSPSYLSLDRVEVEKIAGGTYVCACVCVCVLDVCMCVNAVCECCVRAVCDVCVLCVSAVCACVMYVCECCVCACCVCVMYVCA